LILNFSERAIYIHGAKNIKEALEKPEFAGKFVRETALFLVGDGAGKNTINLCRNSLKSYLLHFISSILHISPIKCNQLSNFGFSPNVIT
jgi:hypothetical protein